MFEPMKFYMMEYPLYDRFTCTNEKKVDKNLFQSEVRGEK